MFSRRVLVVSALAGMMFAGTDVQAIVTKKSNSDKDIYDRPAVSRTDYSKTKYDGRVSNQHTRRIRNPERPGVDRAPKKERRRSHFTEWP
ncbi:MAG: hypothetical protein ACK4UN_16100 [Limisphaerales bacterium]